MNVNADEILPVTPDIVWAHQVLRYTKPKTYEVVTEDEESKRFVNFNYYYRVIDWYREDAVYYEYIPIGKKELNVENIGVDFHDEYLENYDGIGPFYIPDIDAPLIEIMANKDAWYSTQLVFGIERCKLDCATEAEIDFYIEAL
jgi:hypothetical protein